MPNSQGILNLKKYFLISIWDKETQNLFELPMPLFAFNPEEHFLSAVKSR